MGMFSRKEKGTEDSEIMPMGKAIKEVGLSAGGSVNWDFESMFTDGAGWPHGIHDEMDAYKKVGLVRTCINVRSYYTRRDGYEVKVEPYDAELKSFIDDMNFKVNLGRTSDVSLTKRQIFGRCGWEIVWGEVVVDGQTVRGIDSLLQLKSKAIKPKFDDNEPQKLLYYDYAEATNGRLDPRQALYFELDSLDRDKVGISGVDSVKDSVNARVNLNRDLLESSKRLWAPFGMFKMNTEQWLDPAVKKTKMEEFARSIIPGRTIVYNTAIEDSKVVDLQPNLINLIRSLEKVDEDIMGFWMIPKEILARGKTVNKATLTDAMEALYVGPVNADQSYMKEELEKQWYPKLVAIWKQAHPDKANKVYKVQHIWKTQRFLDPALVRAFAYAVRNKVMTSKAFFEILHIPIEEGYIPETAAAPTKAQQAKGELEALIEEAVELEWGDLAAAQNNTPSLGVEDGANVEEI